MGTYRYSIIIPDHKVPKLSSLFISHSRYNSDWLSIVHTHPFTEIFYVVDGKGRFFINEQQFDVKKNDVIIINPNIEHTEFSSHDHPLEYITIGVSHISFMNKQENTPFLFLNFQDKEKEVLFYLESIIAEAKKQEFNYQHISFHLLNVLIYKLQRNFNLDVEADDRLSFGKEVFLAKEYINHNFKENITLNQLASLVHLNKFYLSRIFKTEIGYTPIDYLNKRRVEEAKVLLQTTNLTISEISNIIGFTSQSYFSQVFKRYFQQSPSSFREK